MREKKILDGDHASMTDMNRRTHYAVGCRHDDCRASASHWRTLGPAAKADAAAHPDRRTDYSPGWQDRLSPAVPTRDEAVADEVHDVVAELLEEPVVTAPKPAPPAPNMIAAQGASRRLQALVEMGYCPDYLATSGELPADTIWWLLIAPPTTISVRLHVRISNIFKALRLHPLDFNAHTVSGRRALRARGLAQRHHWRGPYDWRDLDFDVRPVHGLDKNRDEEALEAAIAAAQLADPADRPEVVDRTDDVAALELKLSALVAELDQARTDLVHEQAASRRTAAELNQSLVGAQASLEHVTAAHTAALAEFDREYFRQKQELDQLRGGSPRKHAVA